MISSFEKEVMADLLKQAALLRGRFFINPLVAAAVIKNNTVISIGVHQGEGSAHAEVIALKKAGEKARGATLLCTLEPCTHYGKTAPCNLAIRKAGIARVVYAIKDPNPKVSAENGDKLFQSEGIVVESGVLSTEAWYLNDAFFTCIKTKRPFITAKVAQSYDHKIPISTGDIRYITNKKSLYKVHQIRRENQAIVTGIGTILTDNPSLTVRYNLLETIYHNPDIFILDSKLKTPVDAKVITETTRRKIFIFTSIDTSRKSYPQHVEVITVSTINGGLNLTEVLNIAYARSYFQLLLETGPTLLNSFLAQNFIDKLELFIANKKSELTDISSPFSMDSTQVSSLFEIKSKENLDGDIHLTCYLNN